jgi:hypothetical protein
MDTAAGKCSSSLLRYALSAAAGRTDEALAALDVLTKQAEHTEPILAQAAAVHCRGYLAEKDAFESHFTRARALHRLKPTPFEIARTQLRFGEVLRRQIAFAT